MFDLMQMGLDVQAAQVEANNQARVSEINFVPLDASDASMLNTAFCDGLILQKNESTGQRLMCERIIPGFSPIRGTFKLIDRRRS